MELLVERFKVCPTHTAFEVTTIGGQPETFIESSLLAVNGQPLLLYVSEIPPLLY